MNHIYLLSILLLLLSGKAAAQEEHDDEYDMANSPVISLGIGAGPNYGMFGAKMVIGPDRSGLMIGLGSYFGYVAYEIGFQKQYRSWFINAGYGTYGLHENGYGRKETVNGLVIMTGSHIPLGSNDRSYIEIGIGYGAGAKIKSPFGHDEPFRRIIGTIGCNIKINR